MHDDEEDYDVQRDIVSDYIAPGLALAGVGVTAWKTAREVGSQGITAPWRQARAQNRFWMGLGEAASARAAQWRTEVREAYPEEAGAVYRLLIEEMKPKKGAQGPTPWKISSESMDLAWQLAHRQLGLDAPELIQPMRFKGFGHRPLLVRTSPTTKPGDWYDYMKGRPELGHEIHRYLRAIPRDAAKLGDLLPGGLPDTPYMPEASFGVFDKAGKWTAGGWSKDLAQVDLSVFSPEIRESIEQMVEKMGRGTEVSWARHPTAKNVGPIAIRFKSNEAVLPIPLVAREGIGPAARDTFVPGKPPSKIKGVRDSIWTMFLGPGGERRVAPRRIGIASEAEPWIRAVHQAQSGTQAQRDALGQPRTYAMDEYMLKELRDRWDREILHPDPKEMGRRASSLVRGVMEQVVFEGREPGYRGAFIRNQVQWIGADQDWMRMYAKAQASMGFEPLIAPEMTAKGIVMAPGVNWGAHTPFGAWTRARPDQLAREMSLTAGSRESLGSLVTPMAVSAERAAIGRRIGEEAMSIRVTAISPESWTLVARQMGMPADISKIAAEEIVASKTMSEMEFRAHQGFVHAIDPRTMLPGERISRIADMLGSDKALADANANGKLRDYISSLTDVTQKGDLEELFQFNRREFVGFTEAGGVVKAGALGGRQQINHVMVTEEGIIKIVGDEFYQPEAGFKFQGGKLTKKTVKGFYGRGFEEAAARALAISERSAEILMHPERRRHLEERAAAMARRIGKTAAGGVTVPTAETLAARQAAKELFEPPSQFPMGTGGRGVWGDYGKETLVWQDRDVRRMYRMRVHGSLAVTTEGIKAPMSRNMDEMMEALSEEVFHRVRTGQRPAHLAGRIRRPRARGATPGAQMEVERFLSREKAWRDREWGERQRAAIRHMRVAGWKPGGMVAGVPQWEMVGGKASPANALDDYAIPINRYKKVMEAANIVGVVDLERIETSVEELFAQVDPSSSQGEVQQAAWKRFSQRYGMIGSYAAYAAPQGPARALGAGKRGSANQSVVQMLRAQGNEILAEEMARAIHGKADEFVDLMRQISGVFGSKPEKVVTLDQISGFIPARGEAGEHLFAADPAKRREFLETAFGIKPGEDWGIDLGKAWDLGDDMRVRYLRPGNVISGAVGANILGEDREILRSVDASLRGVLEQAVGMGPRPTTEQGALMKERLTGYFDTIAEVTMQKRQAMAHAFGGPLERSVQLQYQSSLQRLPGARAGQTYGFFLSEKKAAKSFELTPGELKAFQEGGTKGRVVQGALYGTIHRQPTKEGMLRVTTTKFLSAQRYIKDTAASAEMRDKLRAITDFQVFANETFDPILGADKDGDQVYLHALDPENLEAQDMARGVTETRIELAKGTRPDDIKAMLELLELRSQDKTFQKSFADTAFRLGTMQHEYMQMQDKISAILKSPGEVPTTLLDAFRAGRPASVRRTMIRLTEQELEKQVIGHISNTADVALRGYLKTTKDLRRISSVGIMLGNLSERVLKGKYMTREHIQQGSELAMELVTILRKGDFTRSKRFVEIAEMLFNPQGEEGRQLVSDITQHADELLRATYDFRQTPEYKLMRQTSKRVRDLKGLREIYDLIHDPTNADPLATYYRAAVRGEGRLAAAREGAAEMAHGVRGMMGNVVGSLRRHGKWAAAGIGAGVALSMVLGKPGRMERNQDAMREGPMMHAPSQGMGSAPEPAPRPAGTARVRPGMRTEVRAVAGRTLDGYTQGSELADMMSENGSDVSIRMRDHRSHIDEERVLRLLGV